MRILMTTDTVGGVWTFTSELTQHLLANGHAVHLVSVGRMPSPEQGAWVDKQVATKASFAFTATAIPLEWMQNNEHAFQEGERVLLQIAASFRPDLILANQFCFGGLHTAIPKVVVAHSDVLSWARACRPSALEPSPWLDRYKALVQTGLAEASAVVAPTAWMGQELARSFRLPHHLFVIPNGITMQHPDATLTERRIQAVTAGRLWDEAKGLDTLCAFIPALPLFVAGDHSFEAEGSRGPWPKHLQNLGPLSHDALLQFFRDSSVYLCTSRYEPFGLAPLEAALCGCAVVARDLPSLREVWEDGAVYFHDDASLQRALLALAHDREGLDAARARSSARALRFSGERMADSYLHLFHSIAMQQAVPHVA